MWGILRRICKTAQGWHEWHMCREIYIHTAKMIPRVRTFGTSGYGSKQYSVQLVNMLFSFDGEFPYPMIAVPLLFHRYTWMHGRS